jgi:guanylate kinase
LFTYFAGFQLTIHPNSTFMQLPPSAKVIILTAPSGAGKTSITRYLLQQLPVLRFSISATTRRPRTNERDGIDYHFLTVTDFQKGIEENAFVEWEMVYEGKYYGTLRRELEATWTSGKVPLLDIDVKGAIHVQRQFPHHSLSIFIQAPSVEELRRRLESRGTETPESLQTRISKAGYEMSFVHNFDVVIVNDDLNTAQQQTLKIVTQFLQC